jgi:hypothetical protein
LGIGSVREYSFDAEDRLTTQIEYIGANPITTFIDSYDPVDNRIGRIENGAVFTWTYDVTYSYDGNDNRLTSPEIGALTFWTYNAANQLVTAISGGLTTTNTYNRDGCETLVQEGGGAVYAMGYDNMLRLNYQIATNTYATYTYDADGCKWYEDASTGRATVIWDGDSYLRSKS